MTPNGVDFSFLFSVIFLFHFLVFLLGVCGTSPVLPGWLVLYVKYLIQPGQGFALPSPGPECSFHTNSQAPCLVMRLYQVQLTMSVWFDLAHDGDSAIALNLIPCLRPHPVGSLTLRH